MNLRFVPSLSYVQVEVHTDEGLFDVDPRTVEVIEPAVVTIEALEADDPITKDPSWRRIIDLAQAAEENLLEVHDITGGSWEEMFAELDAIVAPLVTDGWEILDRQQEESPAHGDSVICSLKRGRTQIDVEYFHDRGLQVWDGKPSIDPDNCDPPLFEIEDATPRSAAEAFRTQGWLPPA